MFRFKLMTFARFSIVCMVILVLVFVKINRTTAQVTGLFVDIEDGWDSSFDATAHSEDPTVLRTRYVRPNPDLLLAVGSEAETLQLNLFEDAVYTGVISKIQENRSGSTTWRGGLEGIEFSNFTLVSKKRVMLGTVKLPGVTYWIGHLGEGVHVIQELDQRAFPPEMGPVPAGSAEPERGNETANTPTADDGSVIDVLVVYTEAARLNEGNGSIDAIELLIDLVVADANTGYSNSGVSQRMNLVHAAEVTYDETIDGPVFNWGNTLARLHNPSDGHMDDVHPTRDSTCADAVVLLVENHETACGIGYIMQALSTSFAPNAFSVVSTYCAGAFYSFAHELGHNMGSAHNRENASIDGVFEYSYGYRDSTAEDPFRTIMAYDCPGGCDRLNYWSNPDILMDGHPMGVVYTDPLAADNRRSLNNTAFTVSNFRDSRACINISGYVRDPAGTGIEGVSVDFGGAQTAVPTDGDGYYIQSGFANGDYTVSFNKYGYSFSPVEDLVAISDASSVHDAVGYPFNPANLPFNDGFESGSLEAPWAVETDYEGRAGVHPLAPNRGTYSLLLDDEIEAEEFSHAAVILPLVLSPGSQVDLSFWWREFFDENHVNEDGVFVSDDDGNTWAQAFSFIGTTNVYTHTVIDLDSAASAAGMSFNSHFLVKFQFYDNYPIDHLTSLSDGYAIDDVWVSAPVGPLVIEGHSLDDDSTGDSSGDGDGSAECGEIIELGVDLTNQGLTEATVVTATLDTQDPYITFLSDPASGYLDIVSGGNETNSLPFVIEIGPEVPQDHTIPFSLDITANNGGPWTGEFEMIVGCSRVYLPLLVK